MAAMLLNSPAFRQRFRRQRVFQVRRNVLGYLDHHQLSDVYIFTGAVSNCICPHKKKRRSI